MNTMRITHTIDILKRPQTLNTLSAKIRWIYWRHIRLYDLEVCHCCGKRVMGELYSWWQAPDDLWLEIMGNENGILCPPCFVSLAKKHDKLIYWVATVYSDTLECDKCHAIRPYNEIVVNWGWCNECFTNSYIEYIEETAGPFETLPIPQPQ